MLICYKKWHVIDSQTTKYKYNQSNSIKLESESIKSSLCDYSDPYILVTGDKTVNAGDDTHVAFKNCASFSTCKTEINDVFVDEQITFKLQCLYTIWLNMVIIIQIYQEVYGCLKEMNLQLIMLIWVLMITVQKSQWSHWSNGV